MKIIRNQTINGKHKPIYADLFYKDDQQKKPVVLFVHGYKGFKDWGCWDLVAEHFAKNDIFFLKMNFSHNGTTLNSPSDFSDLEAFGHNNFSKEMDDLQSVIDWIFNHTTLNKNMDKEQLALMGHSRGGGIVTLTANEDKRVARLLTWASVSDYEARFPSGEILSAWKEKGVAYIENTRTRQQMPHYIQFYEDFMEHKDRFSIQNACQKLKIPTLILHGTNDEVVPLKEAENLHKWNKSSKLSVIQNANHVFGGSHPWQKDELPQHLSEVVDNSIVFVKKLAAK